MFLLVPVYPGCPGQTAVKWLLLLLQNFLIAPRNLLAMAALQCEVIDRFQKKNYITIITLKKLLQRRRHARLSFGVRVRLFSPIP